MLPPYVFQQQPELLFTPQVVNLNPQIGGPFGPQGPQFVFPNQGTQQQFLYPPNQGSQPLNPVFLPNNQQDLLGPLDPNAPLGPQQPQNPVQVGALWWWCCTPDVHVTDQPGLTPYRAHAHKRY